MGVETPVVRNLRYAGAGCAHEVLLQARRPSYPNHDQGAADAADALCESALAHLRDWFAAWVLPRLCSADHTCEHVADEEAGHRPDAAPFTWVEVRRTLHAGGWMTLDADDGEPVTAYWLPVTAGESDLRG